MKPLRTRLATFLVLLAAGAALAAPTELESLLDRMGGADTAQWYPAYRTLLDRKDAAVVGPLLERIGGWQPTPQSYGISILQTLPAEKTESAWRKLLVSDSPFLRVCAASQMRSTEPAKAAKVAAEAVAAVKQTGAATMVLARLHYWKDAVVQKAVRALVRTGGDPNVLGLALDVLRSDEDRETIPIARTIAAGGSPVERALAAAWLVRFGEDDFAAAIADAVKSGDLSYSDFNRVRPWLEDADRVPETVLAAATERVEIEQNTVYAAALAAFLGKARCVAAIPVLRRLADHESAAVSKAAFEALVAIPGGIEAESLRGQLSAKEPARRLAAATALRRADDWSGLPVVLDLAKPGSSVRREAVEALGEFRNAAAIDVLLDALEDGDLSTRANAYTALGYVLRAVFPYRRFDLSTTGYNTSDDGATRAKAVAAIRAWWQANRDRGW